MAKRFNTTGNCNPKYHYMVNIDDKLEQIEALINDGLYTRGLKKAYLITFSFLKDRVVLERPEWKTVNGVDVYEGIIWAKKR